jgi:basic membrane protein A
VLGRARDYVAGWRGHRFAGKTKVTRGDNVRISRKLRALLGLLMAFMLLAAACGDDSGDDSSSSDTTSADGGGGTTSDLTVGMAYDLGGRGDQSFNDSAAAGMDQAVEEFGIEAEELEPDEGGENRQELLQLLCDNGTDLIIAVGFLYSE